MYNGGSSYGNQYVDTSKTEAGEMAQPLQALEEDESSVPGPHTAWVTMSKGYLYNCIHNRVTPNGQYLGIDK